jgi:hypothetical protein
MAESDNILTKLHDLLLYLIPQLNKFPRDQRFVRGIRRGSDEVPTLLSGRSAQVHGLPQYLERKPTGRNLFSDQVGRGTNTQESSGLVAGKLANAPMMVRDLVGTSRRDVPGPCRAGTKAGRFSQI